ncbi:phosphate ABC transporter permease [Dethiosulfovibrio sp. F2B]|uniref:PstA family ABC transporter permease n=1 Tax=Dethiosulfovibrio faecalis TaxID=2720018 RepID=UPI001F2CC46E|nr:phosphate ABC transporter permease [Dethiosulfovibrio faecalis]MCF4151212.1 phosphate ABC transporter permease [Dethiosulfovibrio faecalis]
MRIPGGERWKLFCISFLSGAVSVVSLGTVLGMIGFLVLRGAPSLSFDFLTGEPAGFPLGADGGIAPAIAGTLCLGAVAALSGGFLALGTSLYLSDRKNKGILAASIRFAVTLIAGTPSIVLGLFGYSFLVVTAGFGVCLLSAGLVLGVMIFPYMEVRFEASFRRHGDVLLIPSAALGVSRTWGMIHLVIPACGGELLSALAQSVGFAMGAAAPIMFTGAVLHTGMPSGLTDPVMALPLHLYILVGQGISYENAYGTALVLTVMVFFLNLVAAFRKG